MELRSESVRIVLEHEDGDGDPGVFVEVSNENEGQASLVLLEEDVEQVRDFLTSWLEAQEAGDI
jgi:hypothetical protein